MYLLFSLIMFFIGGAMAMLIRAELFKPGLQLVDPVLFNQMTTITRYHDFRRRHAGFRRPRQLDGSHADRRAGHGVAAHEQFQFLDPAVCLHPAAATLLMPGGAAAGGWTMYPPLSTNRQPAFRC